MHDTRFRNSLRDVYNKARGKGRLEVFLGELMRKDGRVPTLGNILEPYTYQVENKPYWVGFVRPFKIAGTINADRHYCFSKSYLPLPAFDSGDFAYKWANVFRETSKWLDYPIDCFEFFHKYYVKEGNKRASVSRYLNLPGIKVNITRIIPLDYEKEEVRCYHEFLAFERQTGISWLWFSSEGAFSQLSMLMNRHHLSIDDLMGSVFSPYFRMTGNYHGPYDDLLEYLKIFPGKYASSKYQEKALKRAIQLNKQKPKKHV